MRLDELLDDREPEAGAVGLRGVEGAPDPAQRLRVEARAVVRDAQPDLGAGQVLADADGDAAAARTAAVERVDRVRHQVDHDAAQLLGVAADLALAVDLAHQLDVAARQAVAEGLERRVHHVGQPHRAHAQLLVAREAQQVRDRALDARELLERDARVLDVLRRARLLLHLLHQALGGGDRVADLVGDARGELLHRVGVHALERLALAREVRVDALVHLLAHVALAHARLEPQRDTGA